MTLKKLMEIVSAVIYAAEGATPEDVLERIAEVTQELVGAKYVALGVPDDGSGFQYFKFVGMTQEELTRLGHLPANHGLLGHLTKTRKPLRLENMASHHDYVGFCDGHPPMTSFLGVPIQVGGQLFGNLYLSDREDGLPFDDDDQLLVETMAGYAALAIAGAQLHDQRQKLSLLEERERIGMDLHDGIIQSLYAIGMQVDLLRLNMNSEEHAEDFARITSGLNTVIEDIRGYILDLHAMRNPTIYDYFRRLINRLYIPETVTVTLDVPEGPPPLPPSIFESVCQIVNEAFSNALRHSSATNLHIRMRVREDRCRIEVVDNGVGFDPQQLRQHSGLGLQNMQNRAQLYGGTVEVQSIPSQGTSIIISIPVAHY